MIQSMTGYARAEGRFDGFQVAWRLKSVNQRYLDLTLRLPEGGQELEQPARQRIKERLNRGSVEGRLSIAREAGSAAMAVDESLLASLLGVEETLALKARGHDRGALTMDRLLTWPGLIRERELPGGEAFSGAVLGVLEQALEGLAAARATEGAGLVAVMGALLAELEGLREQVMALLPRVREAAEERLRARLRELVETPLEESRVAQEVALLLTRLDVSEELDRLGLHLAEMRRILAGEGPVGRRLDFMCQELNREVNTTCSKSQDAELSRLGVEMKVVVEKLREQAQNLE